MINFISFLFNNRLFVTLGLVNSSLTCDIDTLEIQVFAAGFNMTGLYRKKAKILFINESIFRMY